MTKFGLTITGLSGITTSESISSSACITPVVRSLLLTILTLTTVIPQIGSHFDSDVGTDDIGIALDVAATEFFKDGVYKFENQEHSTEKLISFYKDWCQKYPIVSIEDALSEDDWDGWKTLTDELGDDIQLVGDDLFVTNTNRILQGIDGGQANSILIKVNQIGTLTETLKAIDIGHEAGFSTVISHRSGETEDTTIADLAVAVGAGQIKTGAPCRSDRVAKYNQLLRIEEWLGASARYGNAMPL